MPRLRRRALTDDDARRFARFLATLPPGTRLGPVLEALRAAEEWRTVVDRWIRTHRPGGDVA
jgi:hypothetical protein